jgi:uncharacterized LabA/DUF88 family protein
MISDDLRRQCDNFIELADLQASVARAERPAPPAERTERT